MNTDTDCVFCKIVAGQMPCFKLLEDDNALAIMDICPANDGHCLVLTKEHYPTLFDISDEAFAAVSRSIIRVARAVKQALSPGLFGVPGCFLNTRTDSAEMDRAILSYSPPLQ